MKPVSNKSKQMMLVLLLNTAVFATVYFLLVGISFPIHYIYLAVGAALLLFFVIYNRGFSAKGVTPDMLPDTMSMEEKLAFIEDGKQRLKRSRIILIFLLPIIFTFAFDLLYLYFWPMLESAFK